MKSIMHDKREGTCYLCKLLYGDDSHKLTQEHHAIFGRGKRKLSERYGLKVYLCIYHHTEGKEAVHKNKKNALLVKQEAQKAFIEHFPELDFTGIFGKNYMDGDAEEDSRQKDIEEEPGIFFNQNLLEETDWNW